MVGNGTLRFGTILALGAALGSSTGCFAARAVADGLADEGPPGRSRVPSSPLAGPSSDRSGAGLGDGLAAMPKGDAVDGSATSTYVVSPALTWGELQLHRPHAITGVLHGPDGGGPECRSERRTPFEITYRPTRTFAEEVVRHEHVPFGVRSTLMPIGPVFSLDRRVMADHVLRSGAYLVQRGPVCFESLYLSVFWTSSGGRDHGGAGAYW